MKIDVSTQRAKEGRFTRVVVEVSDKELARVKACDPAPYLRTVKRAGDELSSRILCLWWIAQGVEAAKRGKR